jgi:hypothetical protein
MLAESRWGTGRGVASLDLTRRSVGGRGTELGSSRLEARHDEPSLGQSAVDQLLGRQA